MNIAIEEARTALDNGEFPVGCVIVQGDRVIASGKRTGTTGQAGSFSEIEHAEINALKALESAAHDFNPSEAVIFSTMEPCLMCFGAIMIAGIKTIVYAYEDAMGGGTGCDLQTLPELYSQSDLNLIKGIMREESLALFYEFFNKKDNLYWKNSFLERYTRDQFSRTK